MNRRPIIFAILCFLQLLGISGSVIASAIEIESIVVTGPLFTFIGLAAACGWIISRDVSILVFGLSTGVLSLFVFLVIVSLEWSPSDAEFPVPLMLLGYEVMVIPVGLLSMYRMLDVSGRSKFQRKWQFNLRFLFIVTFVLGVGCAAAKLAFDLGSTVSLSIAIGVCMTTVIAAVIVGHHGSRLLLQGQSEAATPLITHSYDD
jgi:hypothetical protein